MKKDILAVTLCLVLTVSISACKKKETQPLVPKAPGTIAEGPVTPGPIIQGPVSPEGQQQAPMIMPRGKAQVAVPDSVKGQWSAAKLIIEDKIAKTKQEYTVKINSAFNLPNSNIKIAVGEFLPDFKMEGLTLTSVSNKPNNPALGIRVLENNKQIFPAPERQWGWLFEKMPAIHPFEHPRYSIILKEGVKKG